MYDYVGLQKKKWTRGPMAGSHTIMYNDCISICIQNIIILLPPGTDIMILSDYY